MIDPQLDSLSSITPPRELTQSEDVLTPEDAALLNTRLFTLLAAQINRKTQGDSTSMRVEAVNELMESIHFTLRYYLMINDLPYSALLKTDLPTLFTNAQHTVLAALEQARKNYNVALQLVHPFGNISLMDTLRGIGGFFARYDARLYAHLIPADIDYQLCLPVPDTLAGVLWVDQYINRLLIENELLTKLDEARIQQLLTRLHPEYQSLLINLYEPVAANVIGLALLGGGITLLELTPSQGESIRAMLLSTSPKKAQESLSNAARIVCTRLGLTHPSSLQYLQETAWALYPRLAVSPEGFRGVFNVCRPSL